MLCACLQRHVSRYLRPKQTNNLRKLAFLLAIMGDFQAWYLIIATKRVYSAILFAVFMGRFSFREVTEHSRLRMRVQIISV